MLRVRSQSEVTYYDSMYIKFPEKAKLQRQKMDYRLPGASAKVGTVNVHEEYYRKGVSKCSKTDLWRWLYNLVKLLKVIVIQWKWAKLLIHVKGTTIKLLKILSFFLRFRIHMSNEYHRDMYLNIFK